MTRAWKNSTLSPEATIREAIQTIEKGGPKIALIVDEQGKLSGTVTDGDIRRGLLRQISLEDKVIDVMNPEPTTCTSEISLSRIKQILQEKVLLHMPIVDQGVLVDLITWDQVQERNHYTNPVILMAGGFGTRLRPLTNTTPKPLLKVGSKPVLERTLEQFVAIGFTNFYITLHYLPEKIQEHFGDGSRWGINIEYIFEEVPLGTGGALSLMPHEKLGDEPIILMNGDLLTRVDFEQLLIFHQDQKAKATMCVREYGFQVPYGVVEVDNLSIKKIVEKPEHRFFVNAGIYVLNKSLVETIPANTAVDMPNFLSQLVSEKEKTVVFPVHEYWLDIGQRADFDQAQEDYKTE